MIKILFEDDVVELINSSWIIIYKFIYYNWSLKKMIFFISLNLQLKKKQKFKIDIQIRIFDKYKVIVLI